MPESSVTVRANRAILKSGRFSRFNGDFERFQSLPNFLNFSPDQTAIFARIWCGQHDTGGATTSVFEPDQRVKKGGIYRAHCVQQNTIGMTGKLKASRIVGLISPVCRNGSNSMKL